MSRRITTPDDREDDPDVAVRPNEAFESATAPATASSPSPMGGQGRSRRWRSARVATESGAPSAGMTSAAAA